MVLVRAYNASNSPCDSGERPRARRACSVVAQPRRVRKAAATMVPKPRPFILFLLLCQGNASHSIGFSGGQLSSYGEGSSALDFPLIHDAQSQDPPQNNVNNINRLNFYH